MTIEPNRDRLARMYRDPLTAVATLATASSILSRRAWFRDTALPMVLLAVQLGLLAVVVDLFNIESEAFFQICLLAFGGALVHAALPIQHRLPFFATLSLVGILMVFGTTQGLWLIAFGLGLIGICHLPLRFGARVLILLAAGVVFAFLRVGMVEGPWSRALWPILGSMFMFRLIVYMYDLRHETGPRSVSRTLAYFFLLPNVCFPMFPVVDYKTFKRTFYNDDAVRIRQIGVEWILRGVVQLILYRFVYYYLTISTADVSSPSDLGRFIVANYLLYLRISGQFHVIVGILRLFGFNLPETHHRYLLASSINDFWRRINIYWKDFMMKLFYYPSFFALRKRQFSERSSLVVATLIVFISTWLLHSYQWFWLRGSFPLTWPDALFWGVLGVLVVGNTLWEASRGRTRRLQTRRITTSAAVGLALRTALTFCFIAVLWSLWTSESISQWFALWTTAFASGISTDSLQVLSIGAAAAIVGSVTPGSGQTSTRPKPSLCTRMAVTAFATLVVCLVGYPRVYTMLDSRLANVIASLREQKLNQQDAATLERGYYENLLSVERFNSQLWELYSKQPADWGNLRDQGGVRPTNSFVLEELIPSNEMRFKGTTVRTNRWGMRAGEYDTAKPPGSRRIVLFGPSDAMGTGVEVEQTFGAVLERRLNAQPGADRHEVLNFGTPSYAPTQYLWLFENRALQFRPDMVMLVGHDDDGDRAVRHLARAFARGVEIPYEPLRRLAIDAGIDAHMGEDEIRRRLRPERERIIGWTYHRMAEICRERQIRPVWVFLPFLVAKVAAPDPVLFKHAQDAGFEIVDLSNVYARYNIADLRIAEWDLHHPNVQGHQMIADRLFESLRNSPQSGSSPE